MSHALSRAIAQRTRAALLSSCAFALLIGLAPSPAHAQWRSPLPATRADSLLTAGRWSEAEALFYRQSQKTPRNAVARAALGQFLAMKGAVRTGIVLMDEARRFGLDADIARELVTPWKDIQEWRAQAVGFDKDSTIDARAGGRNGVLFVVPLPRAASDGRVAEEIVWHDVVDRAIGVDSVADSRHPLGIEIFESLIPSFDVRNEEVTLHASSRSALSATGKRYQVLRDPGGIRVLMGDREVMPLDRALRELDPDWWQLDLVHGLLVVR